jgi:valyl-tRNA synthetase
MIMAGYEFLDEPPFTEVLYTGIVRDEQGRKLSKSLGNSPDPLELMDRYGADALRFVLIMLTPTGQDINFSDETCETGRNFCTKIHNATRLLFGSLAESGLRFGTSDPERMTAELSPRDGEDPDSWFGRFFAASCGQDLPGADTAPLELEDRWVLNRLAVAARRVDREMEARRLNDAAYAGYSCFWNEFCDWYLEAIKPRLRGGDAASRNTALLVALSVHAALLRLLHPFLPYITEELWSRHPVTSGFIVTAPMPSFERAVPLAGDAARFELIREIVGAARNLRSELGVPPGRRGRLLLASERPAELEGLAGPIATLAKLEEVEIIEPGTQPRQSVSAVVQGHECFLPLAGLVDLEKERQRLDRERTRLEGRLQGIRAKLANEKFTSRAPEEVVARERENERAIVDTLEKLEQQIASLEG